MRIIYLGILFFFQVALTSCGYQSSLCNDTQNPSMTLCCPYVTGDLDGELTAEIIRTLSPFYTCKNKSADYILKIKICNDNEENIGFRYDRTRQGKIKHYIIPVETRRLLEAEVELVESETLRTVKGPVILTATTEFDHEYETVRDDANTFSLGQLTDYDAALETSNRPLYFRFAQRVLWFLMYVDGNNAKNSI